MKTATLPDIAAATDIFGPETSLALEPIAQRAATITAVQPSQMQTITPADLLRVAMESGDKDIERLERLMAMDERYREAQERDRQRGAVLAFRRDFAAFRGENVIVPKTKHVERGKAGSFNQAEYDRVCGMLSPALSKHGFGFRHDQKFTTRPWVSDGVESMIPWVIVTCFLEHREGHAETLELEGPPGDLSANTPVQNMQTTASYLKRQSLLAITGTATGGEDDEGAMGDGRTDAPRPGDGARAADAPAAPAATGAAPARAGLLKTGTAKAHEGLAALTDWWKGLAPADREIVMADFGGLKKIAQGARA